MKLNILKHKKLFYPVLILVIITLGISTWLFLSSKPQTPTVKPVEIVATNQTTPAYTDFHLILPSLDISAPIIADVDGTDKKAYFKSLQSGVAHYKNTSKPGEGSNIFIFGHSSYFVWDPGQYKTIFRPLEKIKVGDEVDIWWQSKDYKYKVSETKIVEPTDVALLNPTATEQVTLMTCYPPGTTKQRFIVIAKPI